MSEGTVLQIIGIIVTTFGTLLVIESLWRLRLQRTIKLIEDESNKFGIKLVTTLILGTIFYKIVEELKKEMGIQYYKKIQMTRKKRLEIIISILVLQFSTFIEDVLKKINKYLICIGVTLIIGGASIQIFGVLI